MGACDIKKTTRFNLITEGLITPNNQIVNEALFDERMQEQSDLLKENYNVKLSEPLYTKVYADNKIFISENIKAFAEARQAVGDQFLFHISLETMTEQERGEYNDMMSYMQETARDKAIRYKSNLLNAANRELRFIEHTLKTNLDQKKRSYLKNRQKIIHERIYGSKTSLGLLSELKGLQNGELNVDSLVSIFENDLARITEIANKKELDLEDMETAEQIISFLDAITDYHNVDNNGELLNPIFDTTKFADYKTNATTQKLIELLRSFKQEYTPIKQQLQLRQKEVITKAAAETNAGRNIIDHIVKETHEAIGENDSLEEMFDKYVALQNALFPKEGLSDIGLYSKYFLDPTRSIEGHDFAAQVAMSILQQETNKEKRISAAERGRLDRLRTKTEQYAKSLGLTVSELFKRKTTAGLQTNNLVQRYTQRFFTHIEKIQTDFQQDIADVWSEEQDPTTRASKIEQITKAHIANMSAICEFIDPTALIDESIISEEYRQYIPEQFKKRDEAKYQALVSRLGQHFVDELVEEQKIKFESYLTDFIAETEDINHEIDVLTERISTLESEINNPVAGTTQEEIESKKQQLKNAQNRKTYLENHKDDFSSKHNPLLTNTDAINGHEEVSHDIAFNVYIPRKEFSYSNVDGFGKTNRTEKTDYYDEQFDLVDQNDDAYETWKIASDIATKSRNANVETSSSSKHDLALLVLDKTFGEVMKEIWNDPEIMFFSKFTQMARALCEYMSRMLASERDRLEAISEIDPATGRYRLKVNNSWYSTADRRIAQSYNVILTALKAHDELFEDLSIVDMDNIPDVVDIIKDLFPEDIDWYELALEYSIPKGDPHGTVNVKQMIHDVLVDQLVKESATDFYQTINMMSMYAGNQRARQKSLPMLRLIKAQYDQLRKPQLNKQGEVVQTDTDSLLGGTRDSAVARFDDWYNAVALGIKKRDVKAVNELNKKKKFVPKDEQTKKLLRDAKAIVDANEDTKYNGELVYETEEEREHYITEYIMDPRKRNRQNWLYTENKHLRDKISRALNETSEKLKDFVAQKERLQDEYESLMKDKDNIDDAEGKAFDIDRDLSELNEDIDKLKKTMNSLIDQYQASYVEADVSRWLSLLKRWIRFSALGFNLYSCINNFMEGHISNTTRGAAQTHFTQESYDKSRKYLAGCFLNRMTFGMSKLGGAKKVAALMDKFDVLQDSSDIVERSQRSKYDVKGWRKKWIAPYAPTQNTEFLNQHPILIAILYDTEITDKDGNKSNLFDAYDENGELRDEFRTQENIDKWENEDSEALAALGEKITEAIIAGHGDYEDLHGSIATRDEILSFLTMFKRWMGTEVYNIWQKECYNSITGQTEKGLNHSWTTSNLAGSMLLMTLLCGNPLLVAPIAVTTMVFHRYLYHNWFWNENKTESNVGQEFLNGILGTATAMISMPVNLVSTMATGKRINGILDVSRYTRSYTNATDANNMVANYKRMALVLSCLLLTSLAQGLVKRKKDDDDDELEFRIWNLLGNINGGLASNTLFLYNPIEIVSNYTQIPIITTIERWRKAFTTTVKTLYSGEYIYTTGENAGRNKLAVNFERSFLPGFLRGIVTDGKPTFGLKSPSENIFNKELTFWSETNLFKTADEIAKANIDQNKSSLKRYAKDGKLSGQPDNMSQEELDEFNKFLTQLFSAQTQKDKDGKSKKDKNGKVIKETQEERAKRIAQYDKSNIWKEYQKYKRAKKRKEQKKK